MILFQSLYLRTSGPESESDVQPLKKLLLHVSAGSCMYGDALYTDYTIEDDVESAENVRLCIVAKSNSNKSDRPWERFLTLQNRKRIETTFSEIKNLFLSKIHAVTFKRFLIRIMMFVIAYTFYRIV